MVFPVYNEHNQIIGFSGRHVESNNDKWKHLPKWKHVGKRNNWVYPAFNTATGVDEEIEFKKEVILVESIGDALALYEQGH
jgi:DNA primase